MCCLLFDANKYQQVGGRTSAFAPEIQKLRVTTTTTTVTKVIKKEGGKKRKTKNEGEKHIKKRTTKIKKEIAIKDEEEEKLPVIAKSRDTSRYNFRKPY